MPKVSELPVKATVNNHQQTNNDKMLRSLQQGLLHALRLFGLYYGQRRCEASGDGEENVEDPDILFQIGYNQISELYHKIGDQRKESAIPGSTTST